MGSIVSNATPLIYLARVGRLELLKVFGDVFIPEEVKYEVVERGKELNKKDAYLVEKAIGEGWLKVKKAEAVDIPIKLEAGEMAAISLAKNLGIPEVLIDEAPGRAAAELVGLTPRGTLFVLLKALEEGKITLDELLDLLDDLVKEGFRLKEEVYLEAIRKAREIVGEK
jgi:predicted nucleic acid-binding protein